MHAKTESLSNSTLAQHIKDVAGQDRWDADGWHAMRDTGNVSDFAAWAWQNRSGNNAVKETLSEVARLDSVGQLCRLRSILEHNPILPFSIFLAVLFS